MNRFIFLLVLLVPGLSFAVDGVLEINQTCAVQTGCFAGDSAGFPVSIAQTGSYRLTSNLVLTADGTAIEVAGEQVSLDLNGFSVIGPTVCTGSPFVTSCAPLGSGRGIHSTASGTAVRNGSVRGFAGDGILLDPATFNAYGLIADVRATSNGASGIVGGTRTIVSHCLAFENGATGISLSGGGVVLESVAAANGGTGVNVIDSLLVGSAMQFNGGVGIVGSVGSGYAHNVLRGHVTEVLGNPHELGGNVCDSNTTCP